MTRKFHNAEQSGKSNVFSYELKKEKSKRKKGEERKRRRGKKSMKGRVIIR